MKPFILFSALACVAISTATLSVHAAGDKATAAEAIAMVKKGVSFGARQGSCRLIYAARG